MTSIGTGISVPQQKPRFVVPTDIPDCRMWLRGDMGITLNGSNVSAWADQSGAGHDGAQARADQQPAYNAGHLPYVSFDGSSREYLTHAGFDIGTELGADEFDVFAVSTPSGNFVAGRTGGVPRLYLAHSAWSYDTNNTLTYGYTNVKQLMTWRRETADLAVRRDGTEIGRTTYALTAMASIAWNTGINGFGYMTGDLYEIIIYNRSLSAEELARVEGYLLKRYTL